MQSCTHLRGVGQSQALQGRTDVLITNQNHNERHKQGRHGCHQVQPEGEPAGRSVKEQVVVGVDVVQGLEPKTQDRTTAPN